MVFGEPDGVRREDTAQMVGGIHRGKSFWRLVEISRRMSWCDTDSWTICRCLSETSRKNGAGDLRSAGLARSGGRSQRAMKSLKAEPRLVADVHDFRFQFDVVRQ